MNEKNYTKLLSKNNNLVYIYLLPLLYILSNGVWYGNQMDNTFIFLPFYHAISDVILNIEIPYRLDGVLAGMSIYNIPQFSPTYPFLFLWLPIYGTYEAAINSITLITLCHVFLCAVGSFYLILHLTKSHIISLVGGFFIAFSSTYQSYYQQLPVLMPYCWIPLTSYFLLRTLDFKESSSGKLSLWLGLSAGMLVLSCFNHGMIHALLIFITLAVGMFWSQYPLITREAANIIILRMMKAFSVFIIVSGHYVYAVLSNVPYSIRWLGPFGSMEGAAKIPFDAFNQDKASYFSLLNVIDSVNTPIAHNDITLGVVIIFFFMYAFSSKTSKLIYVVGLVAIYMMLSTLGDNTFISYLNYNIPGINLIRLPTTHFGAVMFLVSIAATVGIAKFINDKSVNMNVAIGSIILCVLLFVNINLFSNPWRISAAIFALILCVAVKRLNNRFSSLIICNLIFAGWAVQNIDLAKLSNYQTSQASDAKYLKAGVVHDYIASISDISEYRVLISDSAHKEFNRGYWANLGLWRGVSSFDVFMNPQPSAKNFHEVYFFNNSHEIPAYLERGGKYVICTDDCSVFISNGYSVIKEIGDYRVMRNENASKIIQLNSNACQFSKLASGANSHSFFFNCESESVLKFNTPYSANWIAEINNVVVPVTDGKGRMIIEMPLGQGSFSIKYRDRIYFYLLILAGLFAFLFSIGKIMGIIKMLKIKYEK